MKTVFLLLFVLISLSLQSQTISRNTVFINEMKTRFPLIYQAIDSTARLNEFIMKVEVVDSNIITQCRSFLTIGYMVSNPEFYCSVDKETFSTFYLIALSQNSKKPMSNCINSSKSFDARNACLNPDWKGVLDSLVKQIGDYHLKVMRKTISI